MTTRVRIAIGAGLLVLAAVAVLAVVVYRSSSEPQGAPKLEDPSGIVVQPTLSPRTALFGDTIRAHVDVVLDREKVKPESVRVTQAFSPWEVLGQPERSRRDAGRTTYLRTTYVLRCQTSPCIPGGQSSSLEFDPVRVQFESAAGDASDRFSVAEQWPVLLVYSRFASANLDQGRTGGMPWRADLLTFPEPSYRLTPGLLVALLLGGAVLAALGAIALAYVAWPRRAPAEREPEPEPEPEPLPSLSPLEQALILLEESVRRNGAADQRRALELVAEELELAEWGDTDLARTARSLAWSEAVPPVSETTALAARVRSSLEALAAQLEAELAAADEAQAAREAEESHVV